MAEELTALLPQSGGFERFAWVVPGSEMSHLAVLASHGVRPEELDRLSAPEPSISIRIVADATDSRLPPAGRTGT